MSRHARDRDTLTLLLGSEPGICSHGGNLSSSARNGAVIKIDSSGNVANINVFAPDGLVGRKEGSTWTYYTFDQQGNVAQRLNSSQVVQTPRVFDAWGEGAETIIPHS